MAWNTASPRHGQSCIFTAPASIGPLGVQKIGKRALYPRIIPIPHAAKHIGRQRGMAGIQPARGRSFDPSVLTPGVKYQLCHGFKRLVLRCHAQLHQVQRAFQRGKRRSLEQLSVRRGPPVRTLVVTVGENDRHVCGGALRNCHGLSVPFAVMFRALAAHATSGRRAACRRLSKRGKEESALQKRPPKPRPDAKRLCDLAHMADEPQSTDVLGSYTGTAQDGEHPVQDADDL